ncbi:unnamed protein product [Phytophthora lilii]|uniref:Unnamed protein product n=1 Tax=Phytophthora lilii TaxID=2077276 RepID=A0A9W6X5Y9_9STRA|nr:unnamed protein product [Phytophthora lilii]
MFAYELEGLKRLNIDAARWGSTYRVKVRGRTGKMAYVSNVSRPTNQKLLAKQYKISVETLKKHMSPDYKTDPKYRFYNGTHMESHLYEGIQPAEFYDKLENDLAGQTNAFKVNIALGYDLTPVAINRSDIRKKIISEIRSMELANTLNYPKSGYKLKSITGFKIYIYFREHALGDSEAVIPKIIRDNKHVINFPKTNNKCVLHCIAWYLNQHAKKDPRRIQAQVKEVLKSYCSYKGISFTLSLFRSFEPIDLLQLDKLEECFHLGTNVYSMDVKTGNVECIRRSEREGVAMDILSHENHALYIKNIDMLQSKYQCSKCEMVFVSSAKLRHHTKNQCELVNIESFPAEPTIYRPAPNTIRSMLTKYSIKNTDQYIDYFIAYDFEAILKPTATQHGENTVFTNDHIPVFSSTMDKYKSLLQKIINAHGLTGMEIPGAELGKTYKMPDVNDWIKEGEYACFFDFHSILGFGKQRSDYGRVIQQLDQVPVFGFNSGRYDINLIKRDWFAVTGTDNIKSVIKNPSYMCIATSDMKMLDISNYEPAGTSYGKYLTTHLGGCKCDDKIRCICGLGEGLFPYEYITAFNVLNQTTILSKAAFDSKLRGTMSGCEGKEGFWYDSRSLEYIATKQKYLCGLCYCQLTTDTASADRMNNKLGHIDGSILISCVKCNTARKDMSPKGFRYKKLLEFNSDRLVYSIDKEEKDIYAKMIANIAGGPSIIFNRYAKRNKTKIRGGKLCNKVIGYDANALYLWALGNDMPCGRLTTVEAYPEIVEDIKNDKIFGFLECDFIHQNT